MCECLLQVAENTVDICWKIMLAQKVSIWCGLRNGQVIFWGRKLSIEVTVLYWARVQQWLVGENSNHSTAVDNFEDEMQQAVGEIGKLRGVCKCD